MNGTDAYDYLEAARAAIAGATELSPADSRHDKLVQLASASALVFIAELLALHPPQPYFPADPL